MVKASQYELGFTEEIHRNRRIRTTLGSKTELDIQKFDVVYIPRGYEHRPDLISMVFYNTVSYWWLILEANGLADPFEGLNVNDRIVIPRF